MGVLIYFPVHPFCITPVRVARQFDDVTGPALVLCKPLYWRGFALFPFISTRYGLFTFTHLQSVPAMQDPRFCSACRAGPFANLQNHLNKCKESKRREVEFMESIRGVKRNGPALESEIRKQWQPPDLIPQVWASGERNWCYFLTNYTQIYLPAPRNQTMCDDTFEQRLDFDEVGLFKPS